MNEIDQVVNGGATRARSATRRHRRGELDVPEKKFDTPSRDYLLDA